MQKKKIKINFGKISAIMLGVLIVLLATDIITKICEEAYHWNFNFITNFIYVESGRRNSGAAFSFLANAAWGQAFLITFTFIMLAGLITAFLILPERFVVLKLALAMIIAGAIGNLIDRIAFNEVRDFVWVNMIVSWACCNFADFWIVFGIIIAAVDMLFLNEWAVIPLTKKARMAQAEVKVSEQTQTDETKTQANQVITEAANDKKGEDKED